MPDKPETAIQFQAIARTAVMASIENKHVQYIAMADRRAQGLLAMSSVLMPLALAKINTPECQFGMAVFGVGAVITIIAAVQCLAPKKPKHLDKHEHQNLLHFSGISKFTENEYLSTIAEAMNDTRRLSEEVARDLYHISNDILKPKFRWLRIAYSSFVIGICLGSGLVAHGYLN